jgi:hypothetical protein
VHKIKSDHDFNETIHFETFRLKFKVEMEICSENILTGQELQVFKPVDPDLAALHHCFFVLSIEMVSVVKPSMVSKLMSPKKGLSIINAPKEDPNVKKLSMKGKLFNVFTIRPNSHHNRLNCNSILFLHH